MGGFKPPKKVVVAVVVVVVEGVWVGVLRGDAPQVSANAFQVKSAPSALRRNKHTNPAACKLEGVIYDSGGDESFLGGDAFCFLRLPRDANLLNEGPSWFHAAVLCILIMTENGLCLHRGTAMVIIISAYSPSCSSDIWLCMFVCVGLLQT